MTAVAEAMPDWLARRLVDAGLADKPVGATRRARAKVCQCGRPIMYGHDADFGYMVAECDPQPLSQFGEAEALIAGRRTFSLRDGLLTVRCPFSIKGSPPGTRGIDVLAAHKCTSTERFDMADAPIEKPVPVMPDEPPF